MSSLVKKGLKFAIAAAQKSNCPEFRVGAVLCMGKRVLGVGHNWFKKTSPNSTSRANGIHAEYHCLSSFLRQGIDVRGATLFVVRISRANKLRMAKPCSYCYGFIHKLRLKRIYYTNWTGQIESM